MRMRARTCQRHAQHLHDPVQQAMDDLKVCFLVAVHSHQAPLVARARFMLRADANDVRHLQTEAQRKVCVRVCAYLCVCVCAFVRVQTYPCSGGRCCVCM